MATNRTRKRASQCLKNFNYKLYELTRTLKITAPIDHGDKEQQNISVVLSAFQETSSRSLLTLLCKDGSLLLQLFQGPAKPVIKQIKWFQNPHKRITCLSIDPLYAAWIICACCDSSIYLIPALASLKDPSEVTNSPKKWSLSDLTRVGPVKFSGMPTCIVWWHSVDDRNIGIVGTELGELVFIDLASMQEVVVTHVKEKISKMDLCQDLVERITYLMIQAGNDSTWQLLLESVSRQSNVIHSPSSFSVAFNMGYDTISECAMDSILSTDAAVNKDEFQPVKIKGASAECGVSVQRSEEKVFIVRHNTKFQILEVYCDLDRMPVYTYQLPANTTMFSLAGHLIFGITKKGSRLKLSIVSNSFVSTPMGSESLKRQEEYAGEIQTFSLPTSETVLQVYNMKYDRPSDWDTSFPHESNLIEHVPLRKCIIVTESGVLEASPRISPEKYFCGLAVAHDFGIAEALGMAMNLNISFLCKCLAEKELKNGNVSVATKFYSYSEVVPSERASNLMLYSSMTDGLVFIRQALKQQRSISIKEKKKLSNMAVTCYVHQILQKQRHGNFRRTLEESFRHFLRDSFYYDEKLAMELLISNTMVDEFFEVAKVRGVIESALEMMSDRGIFLLSTKVKHLLLDRGYTEVICTLKDGIFLDHMTPEEAIRFLTLKPNISRQFIKRVNKLLPYLEENSLVQVARIFDPSRSLIKPFMEKAQLLLRKRSPSLISLSSVSTETANIDECEVLSCHELMDTFINILIFLNSKRFPAGFEIDLKQNAKLLSGQHSWPSVRHRQSSIRSTENISGVECFTLACGKNHIAYISHEGDLYTWGKAGDGRLGHGDIIEERGNSFPFCVEGLHMHGIQVLSVACGGAHTVAVCKEGVYSWGLNNYGQLGTGDFRKRSRPCQVSSITSHNMLTAACGNYHTLAICSNNDVWSWGWGIHGQLGTGRVENANVPCRALLPPKERAVQVAAGYAHSAVLSSSGRVYTFGAGFYGQLGVGGNQKKTKPQFVKYLKDELIYIICCGPFETVAVSENQFIFVWGRNQKQYHICSKVDSPQTGRKLVSSSSVDISHHFYPLPMPYQLSESVQTICCGNWHYIAMTTTGQVYTWGCNDSGQLGHYNKTDQSTPRLVKALNKRVITAVAAGGEFSVAVDSDGKVLAWGRVDDGQLGMEGTAYTENVSPGNRKSPVAILSPTQVPGLPIYIEEASLATSNINLRQDTSLDKDSDLPDFSTFGRSMNPYSPEALLAALQMLFGTYSDIQLTRVMISMNLWFPASFTLRLQQEWEKAFFYDVKALSSKYKLEKEKSLFSEDLLVLVEDILSKVEDSEMDSVCEVSSAVELTAFLLRVLTTWRENKFNFKELEDRLSKRVDLLAPHLTMILFRGYLQAEGCIPKDFRIVFGNPANTNVTTDLFTVPFLVKLTTVAIEQITTQSNNFLFLIKCLSESSVESSNDLSSMSVESNVKELLVFYLKRLRSGTNIYLTSATAATLSAASAPVKTNPLEPWLATDSSLADTFHSGESDSVVFSCNHNFPMYYMTDVILPEFKRRMVDLPQALPVLTGVLVKEYNSRGSCINAACPCCVYNNLRQEQLQLLQVSGDELNGNRSTYWEI